MPTEVQRGSEFMEDARGGRFDLRGHHLERRRAAAGRDRPRHQPDLALRPLGFAYVVGGADRAPGRHLLASAFSASRSGMRTSSIMTSSATTRCSRSSPASLRPAPRLRPLLPETAPKSGPRTRPGRRAWPLSPHSPTTAAIQALFVDLFLQAHQARPRARSSLTSTRPTFPCTGIKRAASSTATTTPTATCRLRLLERAPRPEISCPF